MAEKQNMFLVDLKAGLKSKNDRYFCFTDFHAVRVVGNVLKLSPQVVSKLNQRRSGNCNVNLEEFLKNEPPAQQEPAGERTSIVAKHLCGDATDIILQYPATEFGIALCCHSKSLGENYVNKAFIRQFDTRLFKVTSWQHCFGGTELNELQRRQKEAGFKARQILDVGRLLWLRERGYEAGLERFCSDESGEQWLLWARKAAE